MAQPTEYFERQKSPQKEICLKLRKIILARFPNISEEMKWGVPAYGEGKIYIVALKDHVNLGFSLKALPKEKQQFLKGSGKTMKHIEFSNPEEIDEIVIVDLLNSVLSS